MATLDRSTAPQAPEPLVFLSHAGEDAERARELGRLLRRGGVKDVWLDVEQLRPGDDWFLEMERALRSARACLVYVGSSGVRGWVDMEARAALDRSARERAFRIIPVLGPGAHPDMLGLFLKQRQWYDLRQGLREGGHLEGLLSVLRDLREDTRPEDEETVLFLPLDRPPFLGLRAFDEESALLFYGRDKETQELLTRLQSQDFLAVVGASGSGKSSLVRAGLVPALRRGRYHDGRSWVGSWRVAFIRPGDRPFSELAEALPQLKPEMRDTERLDYVAMAKRELAGGAEGLRSIVASLVDSAHVLLIVDQFEELFTLCRDRQESRRFIDMLIGSASGRGGHPVHVVVTLRADFYHHCFDHSELLGQLENQFPVRRMDHEAMKDVIEKPLRLAGLEAEPGLVNVLLNDAGEEPGNLPLLEHALLQLWERREGRILTHRAYEEIGRLSGALRNHAEQVYEGQLRQAGDRELARKLFLRLTQLGEGAQDTRRRERKADLLVLGDEGESVARVLKELSDARLISISGGVPGEPDGRDETVEVAHEALIRGWPRLQEWVNEDRESLRLERTVLQAATEWEMRSRDPGLLLRARLREVATWFKAHESDVPPRVREYIQASVSARNREIRRRRGFVVLATALVVGAAGAVFFGYLRDRQATLSLQRFQRADRVARQMLSIAGNKEMDDVPQVGELRVDLLTAASLLSEGLQVQESSDPQLRLQIALATRRQGEVHRQLKHNQEARAAYDAAIAALHQLVREFPAEAQYSQELAECYNELGELLRDYDRPEARRAYGRALDLQAHLVRDFPQQADYQRELARTTNNRGIVMEALGDDEAARRDYEDAIRRYEALCTEPEQKRPLLTSCSNELSWAYNNLGTFLRRLGDAKGAETSYGKAISLGKELIQAEPGRRQYRRDLATYYNNLANVHYASQRREEALQLNRRALDLLNGLAAPAPRVADELANALYTLGATLAELERPAEAAGAFDKAIAIYEEREQAYADFSKEPILNDRFAHSLLGRGKVHFDLRQFDDATKMLCRASGYHRDPTHLETDYWYLWKSLEATRHVEAARLARRLYEGPPSEVRPLEAARSLAHCLRTNMGSDGGPARRRLQTRAVELLQDAARGGSLTTGDLGAPEFDGLRQSDEFRRLLASTSGSQAVGGTLHATTAPRKEGSTDVE